MSSPIIYTVGGTVQAGGGLYIPRQADQDLLALCRSRTFAYVLTPRQMGKSSLMVQTAATLTAEGVHTVIIDLTEIGTQVSPEAWFLGVLTLVEDRLMLDTDLLDWWEDHAHLGLTQRFTSFFSEVVLAEIEEPVVVFVDEIDTTLSLDFTDDFFVAIRYFYTARAQNPAFNRLSFVLIGVATPADLIRDPQRTPFNVGQRVDLTDFTAAEAAPLAAGLGLSATAAEQVLGWVLDWTGGHPYLTQRLCQAVAEAGRREEGGGRSQEGKAKNEEGRTKNENLTAPSTSSGQTLLPASPRPPLPASPPPPLSRDEVDRIVASTFFGAMAERDNNLQFVRDMLTQRSLDIYAVLTTYREIWHGRRGVVDEEQSLVKSHLKLAGVVKREADKTLRVRNGIYATVFDDAWVRRSLPINWRKQIRRLRGTIAAGAVVMLGMAGLTAWALWERGRATTALATVEIEKQRAEDAAARAEAEAQRANKAFNQAQQQQQEAEASRGRAEEAQQAETQQRQRAESALRRAMAGEAEANRQTHIARIQTQIAEENSTVAASASKEAKLATLDALIQKYLAEMEALNADIKAESLTVESLMASDLHFKALLKGIELGKRIQSIEAPVARPHPTISYAKQEDRLPANNYSAMLKGGIRPEVKLQAAAALREIYNFPGYLHYNVLRGHTDLGRSVNFSPDGITIASASDDGTIKLWDKSGRELQTLEGHTAGVLSVNFSPDGNTIASASADGTIKLWDKSGRELQTLEGHTGSVRSVSFSPDGTTLASASDDGTIKLWDRSGREIQTLEGHRDWVWSVQFSPDGTTLASASYDGTVKLWDKSGQELQTLEGHTAGVLSVSFSPDGITLASASDDGTVKLWDRSGQELQTLEGHRDWVRSVSFSPDGTTLASASYDGTVKLWDRSGRELQTLEGHRDWVRSVSFSPDGTTLASANNDGTINLWDKSGRELQTLEGHRDWVRSVSFSPDGTTLASASADGTVKLWDKSGQELQTLEGHTAWVRSIRFSPDGTTLASASDDGTIKLWDKSGRELQTLEGHTKGVWSVSFSPDGTTLASASDDGTIKLWDKSGQELKTLEGHTKGVWSVSFSPDSTTLASASDDGTVKLWDKSGRELQTLEGHTKGVWSVSFSPDGNTLASASADGTVKLWSRSGRGLQTLEGHTKGVWSVSFSPDGNTLASASDDGTIKLWDSSGRELQTLEIQEAYALSVSFSPDGKTLVSGDGSQRLPDGNYHGKVILWNIDLDDLLIKSCTWLRDYMTNPATPETEKALCRDELGLEPLAGRNWFRSVVGRVFGENAGTGRRGEAGR